MRKSLTCEGGDELISVKTKLEWTTIEKDAQANLARDKIVALEVESGKLRSKAVLDEEALATLAVKLEAANERASKAASDAANHLRVVTGQLSKIQEEKIR